MNRTFFTTSTLALTVAAGLSGCKSFSKQQTVSLRQVDELVSKIEHVHLESELSRESAHDSLDSLEHLTSPKFNGDAVAAYEEFVLTIERSEDQAKSLERSIRSMEKSADEVFEQWEEDLEVFTNPRMRRRSAARLEETKKRYAAILEAVEPCKAAHEEFNLGMRDYAFYLSHDFNAGSVSEIEGDLDAVRKMTAELDDNFQATEEAVRRYVKSASLPGQLQEAPSKRDN